MPRVYDKILLGRFLRTRTCGAYAVSEAVYVPNTHFVPHAHERGNISLVLRGQLHETVGRETLDSGAFSVVFKPAGTIHSNRFGPHGARTLSIQLPHDDDEREPALRRWFWFHGGPVSAAALELYRTFCDATASPEELSDLIVQLVGTIDDELQFAQLSTSAPPWIDRVRDLLHDSFPQRVPVAQVAREMRVHPVYLARAFRARFGCAITDYLHRLRVRDAARRLAGTSTPICQVAAASGFADQAHLSRLFKRGTGLTPLQFRRLLQGN
jgi:AraC family transcriptional regulator